MIHRYRVQAAAACILLFPLTAGCKPGEPAPPKRPTYAVEAPPPPPAPATILGLDLGRAVDARSKVVEALTRFARHDTIYASVATTGIGKGSRISVRWTDPRGQVLADSTITVDLTVPALHAFRLAGTRPWPAGTYTVEASLNGTKSGMREFTIR